MLIFTGDINLTDNAFDIGFGVGSKISKGLNPFKNINKSDDDIWIGNFEGVLSDFTDRTDYAKDMFRISTKDFLKCESIIDYYGVANNHVKEHGSKAYHQMCSSLSEICKGTFGSNECKSVLLNHQGKKVSITGFSLRNDQIGHNSEYWDFPEYVEIEAELTRNADAEYKIAYIHWGIEFIDHPYFDQHSFAHWLIDSGFDLVIGMHPHIIQGYEVYKGKYIFYSLGNFIFDMAWSPTKFGAIVILDLENNTVGYDYVKIGDDFCPMIVAENNVPKMYRFSYLNSKIPNKDNIEKYIVEANQGLKAYRKYNYMAMLKNIWNFDFDVLMAIGKDYIKRRF